MNRREAIAALTALPGIAHISKADIKSDDVVVVETSGPITEDLAHSLAQQLKAIWPNNRVLVLNQGIRLKVVSAKDIG